MRIAQVLESEFPDTATDEPEIVAHHLTKGECVESAIPHWQRAGEIAARRFAMPEAIHHFTRAMELVSSLPESATTKNWELSLQTNLAPVYMATTGFGAPKAERAYERALVIAGEIGDSDKTFTAQFGLWMANVVRPKKGGAAARRFVQKLLELAEASGDVDQRLQACHASWTTNFFSGEFKAARPHAEEGRRIYDPDQHANHKFLFGGHDPGACSRTFLALTQVLDGQADTAVANMEDALTLAESLHHPTSLWATLCMFTKVRLLRREPEDAHDHLERVISLAEEHGISTAMWSDCFRGWVLCERKRPAEGLAAMKRTFHEVSVGTWEPVRPLFFGLRAEMYGAVDRPEEGLEQVAQGLELADLREGYWCVAELHRIQGELLRHLGRPASEIEACFHQALEIATSQGARTWHLRAATSLARFWASEGKTTEARELLAPAYGSFTEGFGTADLKDAKALLDELG